MSKEKLRFTSLEFKCLTDNEYLAMFRDNVLYDLTREQQLVVSGRVKEYREKIEREAGKPINLFKFLEILCAETHREKMKLILAV